MSKRPGDNQLALPLPPAKRPSRSSSPAAVELRDSQAALTISTTELPTDRSAPQNCSVSTSHTQNVTGRETLTLPGPSVRGVSDTHNSGIENSPMCFRIANVPSTWNKERLLTALLTVDPSLDKTSQLSLYPACCGSTQTALLNLATCTEYFQIIKLNKYNYVNTSDGTLVIDSHFYDLTPLNNPNGEIVADVVAITGLAGHAFGSWRSRETHHMWLQDFLPADITNIRIMTYGYDSHLIGPEGGSMRMSDYSAHFIEQLKNSRRSAENRPIIFLGHSLGAILVLQVLKPILKATHGIFFFGAPHDGLHIDDLLHIVETDSNGQRKHLIMQLTESSEFLETQKEDLINVWKGFRGRVVSFFETVKTHSVQKLDSGDIDRVGPQIQRVKRSSAQLYLSIERRVPVNKNHADIVKFAVPTDSTYETVVTHLKECIAQDSPHLILQYTIDNVGIDQCIRIISPIDQDKYKTKIPPLNYEEPGFYWIFKNLDFEHWKSDGSRVLWLSAPPECKLDQVASHIVDLEKNTLNSEYNVLYFFCWSAAGRRLAPTFFGTFVHQLTRHLTPCERDYIITIFLHAILNAYLARDEQYQQRWWLEDCTPDRMIENIFTVSSGNELLKAMKEVLDLKELHFQGLLIVIDGLERELQSNEGTFIRLFCSLIIHLKQTPCRVKALLTSRPHDHLKMLLEGIPSIEYDQERKECLNTLRFHNTRYDKITKEHKDSLQWLWEQEEYRSWSSSNRSHLLYIQGKPGSGKSTLTKYFKDNLIVRELNGSSATAIIACFFYSFREGELQKSHYNMLRSILYDILSQKESFFFHFQAQYREYRKRQEQDQSNLDEWHYESLKKVLLSVGNHPRMERIYLVIDAVDESEERDRYDILRLLYDLCARQGYTNGCIVKVFVASRPVRDLDHYMTKFQHSGVIRMQDMNVSDIRNFVDSFLPEIDFPEYILHEATEYIVEHAHGVFLWVRLVRDRLIKYSMMGSSKIRIFDFLKSLPKELEGLYELILQDLCRKEVGDDDDEDNEDDIADGLKMFQFVLFARRPLTIIELQHCLAIPDNLEAEFIPSVKSFEDHKIFAMRKRITHCGRNLIECKEDDTVQVMHQTVSEFFIRPNGSVANSRFGMNKDHAHTVIVTTCFRYLIFCVTHTVANGGKELPDVERWTPEHFDSYVRYLDERPLINYALSYVKDHIRMCSSAERGRHLSLASRLAQVLTVGHFAWCLLGNWMGAKPHSFSERGRDFRNNCLWFAARLGLCQVTGMILTAGAHLDTFYQYTTPLIVAAEGGYDATVRLLLDHGANISLFTSNELQQTALHIAASSGHKYTVKLLLDRGAHIETLQSGGWTALHNAASNGHDSTVQLLLDRGANIECQTGKAETALHKAAFNGHDSTVRLLLDRGANIKCQTGKAETALHNAASNGHDSTVQLLLDRGAKIQCQTYYTETALHKAALNGHESTVRLLLDRGANIECQTDNTETALHKAAFNGHESTVRLLLDRGANIECQTDNAETALHQAAFSGHKSTVWLLLGRGANINSLDFAGRTALHIAASIGCDNIVQILFGCGANTHASECEPTTALQFAACGDHEATVRLLLDGGANINSQDLVGRTALHYAVSYNRKSIVELLLNYGANLECLDLNGNTVLQLASLCEQRDMFQLLRNYSDPSIHPSVLIR